MILIYDTHHIEKVISGGQYGADLGGLVAAAEFGIPTGGYAPNGWRTCRGPRPFLKVFNLIEHHDSAFAGRTIQNVIDSDGTIIFASDASSPGTALTIKSCKTKKKPYKTVCISNGTYSVSVTEVIEWIKQNNIRCLNVAGNRDLTGAKHEDATKQFLSEVFKSTQSTDQTLDK